MGCSFARAALGQRSDPGSEGGDVEGLLEDGVRAELAAQRGHDLGRPGHHQDGEGQRAVRVAQAADDLGAAKAGHHDVDQDDLRVDGPGQPELFLAVPGDHHREGLVLEDRLDESAHDRVVLDHEHPVGSHQRCPFWVPSECRRARARRALGGPAARRSDQVCHE
jgi:hypothetical protein